MPTIETPEELEQIKLVQAIEKRDADRELRALLEQKPFRDFVWDVLADCGIMDDIGLGDDTEYRCGMRKIGLKLLVRIASADPTAYARMQIENTTPAKEHRDA